VKILLISPNTLTVPYPVYPLGLDYVAGAVIHRHKVKIADMNCMDRQQLARLMKEFSPEIIGISCRNIDNTESGDSSYFIGEYADLISWLREESDAVIVCGGAGFTIMPNRISTRLGADYGIIGEGERFSLLVDALESGQDPCSIPGVISRAAATAPPPPWTGERRRALPAGTDQLRFYTRQGGMLNLQSKRGCAFSCIYCPYPRIEGHRHRLEDPDQVAAAARQLQEEGAGYLFLTDSAFNSDIDHSLRVALAFRRTGLTIPWGGFFAPIRMPDDYFATLATCGLAHVEFGTEAMCDAMLTHYRKPFRVDDVLRAHRMAREAEIHTAHYLLLGGPGETEATVNETLDNLEHLDRVVLFFFIGIRIYPGTALYDLALAEGKVDPDADLLKPVFYRPDAIDFSAIKQMVIARAASRTNWIVGSGGRKVAETVQRLHERGLVGPLWEFLAR